MSFTIKKQIANRVVIVWDLHKFKKAKVKKGFMVWKVNLYMPNWTSVNFVLVEIGISMVLKLSIVTIVVATPNYWRCLTINYMVFTCDFFWLN